MKKQYQIKHGGRRTGAGRKPLDANGIETHIITVRLTYKQASTYNLLGKAQWLRAQLDLAAGDTPA